MSVYMQKARSGTTKRIKASASAASESSEASCEQDSSKCYCIFLHVVEGINFNVRGLRDVDLSCPSSRGAINEKVIMNASLNGTQFEVEGAVGTASETTMFNSNILWECDLAGIKRLKTDNRPVKMVFYIISSSAGRKVIGSLLLPLRGLPIMSNSQNVSIKMFWHKLSCLGNEWRSQKPEVNLMLAIVKKSLLKTGEFESLMNCNKKSGRSTALQSPERSLTASMLESQANIYVQPLTQLGLIQLGNEPNVDCDIIEVTLYLKELKNVNKVVKFTTSREPMIPLILILDFVGNLTTVEMMLNESDCYELSEKVGFRFKTSLRMLRLYFQRIFYLPINMYYNGDAIANYRMDFGKYLPEDSYFANSMIFTYEGCFYFEHLYRELSARDCAKPCVEFTYTVEILAINSRQSADHTNLLLQYNDGNDDLLNSQASSSNLHRSSPAQHYARNQKTINIHKLERMEANEKVAAWCEEVFKTHQQHQQQQQSKQRTVRERASDWPPPLEINPLININTVTQTNHSKGHEMKKTPRNEIPLNEHYEQLVESSDSVLSVAVHDANDGASHEKSLHLSSHFTSSVKRSKGGLKSEAASASAASLNVSNNVPHLKEYQMNIIKELDNWKTQEMEKFDLELKRKTNYHLKKLEKQHKQKQLNSDCSGSEPNINKIAKLEYSKEQEQSNNDMQEKERTQHEQQLEQVKKEMRTYYQCRFDDLESHIIRLKGEMEEQMRSFQARQIEIQNENMRLIQEKLDLVERTNDLVTQLTQAKQQHDIDQVDMRKLLSDLSLQNERFFQMEKSRNFYKEQWQRSVQRTHKLELELLKHKERLEDEEGDLKFEFDLSDMIAESEAQSKHSPKMMKLNETSTSSTTESSSSVEYVSGFIDETLTDSD